MLFSFFACEAEGWIALEISLEAIELKWVALCK